MTVRVIARLDIKGASLVKGIHLEGLRVLGRPEEFARHYYAEGADELVYLDVVASLYQRNSLLDIVERTSREVFIPLTVGGGLRSLDDIRRVLRAGADKVSINTAAIANPQLIRDAARSFGSSTVVVSIEAIRKPDGTYEAYTDNGRQSTGVDAVQWAQQAVELGAGEILLTSIDREGTGKGYDLELTRTVARLVPVPVVAAGGAGKIEHVADAVTQGEADAVCVASLLHYAYVRERGSVAADEGNLEFLKSGRAFSKIEPASMPQLKARLRQYGINCRPENAR
ncbi:MAG TPA: imidazole glycerol phosphate synthase cyclase subunit [Burkholderiales bacterium]